MVSVLRIAHEVIARGQIPDLTAGAGCVGALLLRAVFHSDIHAGDLSVASALGAGRNAPQSGGCALPGSFDAPSRRYSVGAAVRPLTGPGRDHDRIVARIRTGVAGDVHACIDAPHIGGLLRAVIDIDALHTDIRPLCRLNRLKLGADGDIRARLGEGIRLVLAPTGNALAPVLNNGQRLQQIPLIGNHRKHHPIALIEQGRAVPGGFRGIRHRDCAVFAARSRCPVLRRTGHRHLCRNRQQDFLLRRDDNPRVRQIQRPGHGEVLLLSGRRGIVRRLVPFDRDRNALIPTGRRPDGDLGRQRCRQHRAMREILLAERIDLGQRVLANLVFQIENRIPAGVSDINIVVNIVVHVCRDRINTVFIRLQNRLAVLHRNRRIIMHLELQIAPIGRAFHPACARIGFACQLPAGGVHYGLRVFAVQDELRGGDVFRPQLIGGLGVDVPLALIVLEGGTYEVKSIFRMVLIPFNTAVFIQLFQLL